MTWTCNCGYQNEYTPDKQKLKCKRCKAVYWVRGLHVDGSPMLALIQHKEDQDSFNVTQTTGQQRDGPGQKPS